MIRILAAVLLPLTLTAPAAPLILAASAASAADAKAPAATHYQFDQLKGVKTWRKGGENIVYVQGSGGDWYKAVMLETCMTLDTKKGISFITEIDPATNAKESRVVVDRHICTVDSLTKLDGPPPAAPATAAK